jgi:hypothetical protein
MLSVHIPLRRGVLDITLCDKVCQWLATGCLFSLVSSTNKTECHDITETLLKVAFNTITLTLIIKGGVLIGHIPIPCGSLGMGMEEAKYNVYI